MRNTSSGFTLVELMIVLLVLLLLGSLALPKYFDLSARSRLAAVRNLAAAISSANLANYRIRKKNPAKGHGVTNCTHGSFLLEEGLPAGYSIISASIPVDKTVSCTLRGGDTSTATFQLTGIR